MHFPGIFPFPFEFDFIFNRAEMRVKKRSLALQAMNMSFFFTSSPMNILVILVAFLLLGNEIGAGGLFLAMSFYKTVQLSMTHFIPAAANGLGELVIALKRIQVRMYDLVFWCFVWCIF